MLKKLTAILIIGILSTGILFTSSASDQLVDAGSRKKIHFTQTVTSSQDPGQGHENHQLAFILSPNEEFKNIEDKYIYPPKKRIDEVKKRIL